MTSYSKSRVTIISIFFIALSFSSISNGEVGMIKDDEYNQLCQFSLCLNDRVEIHFHNSTKFDSLRKLNFRNDHAIPRAIVIPSSERELQLTVSCAYYTYHTVCTRSGGHSLLGKSLCNGILIDMSKFRTLRFVNGLHVADIGPGLSIGEVLWSLWSERRRWFPSGVCPGVGIAGFVLGGGHGPYMGTLGMACDSLLSVRMVDRFGRVVTASRRRRRRLFWAMCGAGGGQFGIVTSFQMKTHSSKIYDNNVAFRFNWPHDVMGEVIEKWQRYDDDGGKTWFRLKIFKATSKKGIDGYGACYDVRDIKECMDRLGKAEFFNVPGRRTDFINNTMDAPTLHAFFSADGNYGRMLAPSAEKALTQMRYDDMGKGNDLLFKSTFLRFDHQGPPSAEFWQKYANLCSQPNGASIRWNACEMNLFKNAVSRRRWNAFPHRKAEMITHYIIGRADEGDQKRAYSDMERALVQYTTGVYVNYPEFLLSEDEYPFMYWGRSLWGLSRVKQKYDPTNFFYNPQPIPIY